MQLFRRFLLEEHGEDLIEYGLLTAFASSVVIAVMVTDPLGLKAAVIGAFGRAATALQNT